MYTRRILHTGLTLLAGCLAACSGGGGRGSAGFDLTENAVISRVLETQQCVSNDSLTLCPADQQSATTPTPTATPGTPIVIGTPTPTATVVAIPQVHTGVATGASVVCTRQQPGGACRLTFSFSAIGFSAGATFRVAARLREPDSTWLLAPAPTQNATLGTPEYDAEVSLPVPAGSVAPRAQFAVLVFLDPPATLPARFEALADTGTSFAFVTAELALDIITLGPAPTASETATETETVDPTTPSPTPSAPTATPTVPVPATGPEITYFGVTRADSVSIAPSGFDGAGRPIYLRPFGHGLSLIVEARPGPTRSAVGRSGFNPSGLPDLQMIVSRPLGDGSAVVCDRLPPVQGGVPATLPLEFAETGAVIDAINDLGCRIDDGQGAPLARSALEACTLNRFGEFDFVDPTTTAQFCLPIAGAWAFPAGDTIVAARVRDVFGNLGAGREIVVRNAAVSGATPTPRPPATATRTHPFTFTPGPLTATPVDSPTITATPLVSSTPTPTFTPGIDEGPVITHLGLARADDRPLTPSGSDATGRPIFSTRLGQGMVVLVEARPGPSGRPVGLTGSTDGGLPDLQMILSRPLGNGDPTVCDIEIPLIGGVPATVPLVFSGDPAVTAAINDLGCRVNDGAGQPLARPSSMLACTIDDGSVSGFGFVADSSTVQYCLPIARAWAFSAGDTVVVARVRDIGGRTGPARAMVVRVGR